MHRDWRRYELDCRRYALHWRRYTLEEVRTGEKEVCTGLDEVCTALEEVRTGQEEVRTRLVLEAEAGCGRRRRVRCVAVRRLEDDVRLVRLGDELRVRATLRAEPAAQDTIIANGAEVLGSRMSKQQRQIKSRRILWRHSTRVSRRRFMFGSLSEGRQTSTLRAF